MFVDPPTPRMKIIRTALVGNTLESSDSDTVVEWDSDSAFFAGLWMCVFQNRVITTCPIMSVSKPSKHSNDLMA